MKSFLPYFVAVACIAPAFAADGWLSDMDEAKKAAAEQNKNILIEFTGSDWCPPCMALKKNVMSKEEFTKPASEQFVLLELDFPKKKEQSEEVKQKNQELSNLYNVEGFPTVVFADAQGVPFGSFVGGQDMDGVNASMTKALEAKVAIAKAKAEAAAAEGEAKIKALAKVLELAPKEYADSFYSDVKKELLDLDKDDISGFRAAADLEQKMETQEMDLMKTMNEISRDADPSVAMAALEKFAKTEGLLPETNQKIGYIRSQILLADEKLDDALKTMEDAIKIAPDSEPGQMLSQMKGFIEQNKDKVLQNIKDSKAKKDATNK